MHSGKAYTTQQVGQYSELPISSDRKGNCNRAQREAAAVCHQSSEVSLLTAMLSTGCSHSPTSMRNRTGSNSSQKDLSAHHKTSGINRINQIKKIDHSLRNVYFRYQVRIREASITGTGALTMPSAGTPINKCDYTVLIPGWSATK